MKRDDYENEIQKENGAKRGAVSIGSLLKLPERPKKTGGVNSPFNDAVAFVVGFMGEPRKFGYWCGRLRGMDSQAIHGLLSQAKEGRNQRALFNFLLKRYRTEHKKVIHTESIQKEKSGI